MTGFGSLPDMQTNVGHRISRKKPHSGAINGQSAASYEAKQHAQQDGVAHVSSIAYCKSSIGRGEP
jgi:hypothetical protein